MPCPRPTGPTPSIPRNTSQPRTPIEEALVGNVAGPAGAGTADRRTSTTSSSWAGTHCWPPGWLPASAIRSTSRTGAQGTVRCNRSVAGLAPAPWSAVRAMHTGLPLTTHVTQPMTPHAAVGRTATACGFWTSWIRATRSTTFRGPCRLDWRSSMLPALQSSHRRTGRAARVAADCCLVGDAHGQPVQRLSAVATIQVPPA